MGLNKSKGNMYDWVTHTWSPIIGCSHQCEYCYVKTYRDQPVKSEMRDDFPKLGKGRTIFVGHLCDMFSEETPSYMVERVLGHCMRYPENTYVFQTKNPYRVGEFRLPENSILGTTIETNRANFLDTISNAPSPQKRADAIKPIPSSNKFITIEPILDFDLDEFVALIVGANPGFVNIGADSKKHNLPEPTREKVMKFAETLIANGITIRKKLNLERLVKQ